MFPDPSRVISFVNETLSDRPIVRSENRSKANQWWKSNLVFKPLKNDRSYVPITPIDKKKLDIISDVEKFILETDKMIDTFTKITKIDRSPARLLLGIVSYLHINFSASLPSGSANCMDMRASPVIVTNILTNPTRVSRELVLMTLLAAYSEGTDPSVLFCKWLNLGPTSISPLSTDPEFIFENHGDVASENDIIVFASKLLLTVCNLWTDNSTSIAMIAPKNWKCESSGLMENLLLHLAMSEIELGTPKEDVVNQIVELSKSFCGVDVPNTLRACLESYIEGH